MPPRGIGGPDVGATDVIDPRPCSTSALTNHPDQGSLGSVRVSKLSVVPATWNNPSSTAGFGRHVRSLLNNVNGFRSARDVQRSSPNDAVRLRSRAPYNVRNPRPPCRA